MDKQSQMTENLIIKNLVWEKKDIYSIIGLLALIGLFIINIYFFHSLIFLLILTIPIGILLSPLLNKSVDTSEKIVIDKNGITIPSHYELIPWTEITFAYIQEHSSGLGRNAKVTAFFHICSKDGEILVNMSKLKYDSKLLKESVNTFSGINIGDYTDKVSEKILKIIGDSIEVQKIERKMSDYFKAQFKSAPVIFLGSFGIAIVLQILIPFPYIIAIWWAFLVFGIIIYAIYDNKTLKKRLKLDELSDEKFDIIIEEYGAQYELNYSKRQTFFAYAFLVFSVFLIFGFSYYYDISSKEREKNKQKEKTEIKNSVHNSKIYVNCRFRADCEALSPQSRRYIGTARQGSTPHSATAYICQTS